VRALQVDIQALKSRFVLQADSSVQFEIQSPGKHHVYNALAAIAVGRELGISDEKLRCGIANFEPGNMRQSMIHIKTIRIIEDCYNANLDSMKAAIAVLASGEKSGRKIAVLGNMFELGEFTEAVHKAVGDSVADNQIDILITVGDLAHSIAAQARARGVETYSFETNQAALEFIIAAILPEDTLLMKASRGAKFEEISQGLQRHLREGEPT
jgi:UDP-N-acetylmuramyl pentapeptide synthase